MQIQNRKQGYFPGSFFNRSPRLLIDDHGFHYRIREGMAIGPFKNEVDAQSDLQRFIKSINHKPKFSNLNQTMKLGKMA